MIVGGLVKYRLAVVASGRFLYDCGRTSEI